MTFLKKVDQKDLTKRSQKFDQIIPVKLKSLLPYFIA